MELPSNGFFCVARSNDNVEYVAATVQFPFPIDLSNYQADIAIKYVAVTPSWSFLKNMFVVCQENFESEDEPSEQHIVTFNWDHNISESEIITVIRNKLELEFKEMKQPLLRMRMLPNRTDHVLRLKADASAAFSSDLAALLNINENYYNEDDKESLEIPIKLVQKRRQNSAEDVYFLKCDQAASNFVMNGKQDRVLELLHVHGSETCEYFPQMTYTPLEQTVIEKLVFSLFDQNDLPVKCKTPDLYVLCHIRRRRTDVP
jgi:hypothetical protein